MEDDEIRELVRKEAGINLLDYGYYDEITIEKSDLVRIIDAAYLRGQQDAVK